MAVAYQLKVDTRRLGVIGRRAAERRTLDATRAVLNRAVVLAPVDTGNLRRNHQLRVYHKGLTKTFGEVYNSARYAGWVHDGTKPYIIRPRKKKALKFTVAGETFIVKKVRHPGIRAQPWLRRALVEVAPRYGFVIQRI